MTLYTKKGDQGYTSVFGSKRLLKSDALIECIGVLDELSSFLGFAQITIDDKKLKSLLILIQKDLYIIMAYLAGDTSCSLKKIKNHIELFEQTIDTIQNRLPVIKDFILTQENEKSARLQITRTVCRRAERILVSYCKKNTISYKKLLFSYINRLSDILFVMARFSADREQAIKTL